jgi:hypothetical protein
MGGSRASFIASPATPTTTDVCSSETLLLSQLLWASIPSLSTFPHNPLLPPQLQQRGSSQTRCALRLRQAFNFIRHSPLIQCKTRSTFQRASTSHEDGGMTMGPATCCIFSSPYSCFTKHSANSNEVPGPRLVVRLPSTTTRSLTRLRGEAWKGGEERFQACTGLLPSG